MQKTRAEDGKALTLRITSSDDGTIHLVGWLSAAEVEDLETCAAAGIRALDLCDLMSADDEGLAALRRLSTRGIEMRNASRYFTILLG